MPAPRSRGSKRRGAARSIPSALLDAQRARPDARFVAVVHAETSTGVENAIAPLAALQETDTLLLVDTVTSLGGIPLEVDGWGIDAAYSGTQKCLGVPPGLSPVTFSPRAVDRIRSRAHPAAVVVPRPRAHRRLRRRGPQVPPHRADRDDLRPARRARRGPRRGPPGRVGAPPRGRASGCSARSPSSASRCSPRRATGSRSSRRPRCPPAPTTPGSARRCSRAGASRSAAGSASTRAPRGGSGSWATRRGSAR